MLVYIRYALATFGFAASVGCLALWGWTATHPNQVGRLSYCGQAGYSKSWTFIGVNYGEMFVHFAGDGVHWSDRKGWHYQSFPIVAPVNSSSDRFGLREGGIYFPIWYSALILALVAVGALRIGRFTIRSAIIATTIVAALLGTIVVF